MANLKYDFGMERAAISAKMREMADQVEAGDLLPQSFITQVRLSKSEFVMETAVFRFARKRQD